MIDVIRSHEDEWPAATVKALLDRPGATAKLYETATAPPPAEGIDPE